MTIETFASTVICDSVSVEESVTDLITPTHTSRAVIDTERPPHSFPQWQFTCGAPNSIIFMSKFIHWPREPQEVQRGEELTRERGADAIILQWISGGESEAVSRNICMQDETEQAQNWWCLHGDQDTEEDVRENEMRDERELWSSFHHTGPWLLLRSQCSLEVSGYLVYIRTEARSALMEFGPDIRGLVLMEVEASGDAIFKVCLVSCAYLTESSLTKYTSLSARQDCVEWIRCSLQYMITCCR